MAIDTKPFVELARRTRIVGDSTHFSGCEVVHLLCAVLYLAGALDAAQKRLDEYLAEIERLRGIIRDVLDNFDFGDKTTINYMVERLQEAK